MDKPLSNYDLMREITNDMKDRANIVDVGEMEKYNNVENIFNGRGHAILFIPPKDGGDVGHWTVLLRSDNGQKCIYYDSYGDKLENQKLRQILNTKYKSIQYNTKRFQEYGSSVCGRYALACIGLNKLIPNLDVKDIIDFLNLKPKKSSYDKYILEVTGKI
jgi:hypothetical protein